MARCPDCNRFVGVEQAEPEANIDVAAGDNGETYNLTGDVALTLTCSECGNELKCASCDVDVDFQFDHKKEGCEGVPEVDDFNAEETDRYEGAGRYAKHFYGATVEVTLVCPECEATAPLTVEVEEQASSFEDI